jgi:RHS repeat-associated protein
MIPAPNLFPTHKFPPFAANQNYGPRRKLHLLVTGTTSKTYDAAGNVLTSTDARGKTTTYTYDALNRLSTATYADSTTASWTYDQGTYGKGHLTTLTDVTGTTTWTYDIHGRVTQRQQTTGSVTLTTGYAYDSYGRIASITYPSGRSVSYSYDSDGRVSTLTSGGINLLSSISYMPFGKVSGWTEGNGAAYSRTIDQDGRISGISIGGTSSVPGTTSLAYTLDNANRITGLTETGLSNKTFGYDNLDRLTSFVNGTATNSYAYDADGNRTSATTGAGTTTYSYPTGTGASNRLSSLSGLASVTYSYDSDGNITGDGTNSWTYDARGRMASDTISSITTSYGINALGQRVTKAGAGVPPAGANEYAYDENGHLLGDYDSSGNPLTETVWLDDAPVAVLTGTGMSAASYQINPDHLNAPHIITDSSGNQVWTWDHLDFGNNAPNQNPSSLGVFNYNPRFPGQYADSESGLSYNRFRDYNPSLGRYVESDPIGLNGGINTYAYVDGKPVGRTDRRGLAGDEDVLDPKEEAKTNEEILKEELAPKDVYGGLDYREEEFDRLLSEAQNEIKDENAQLSCRGLGNVSGGVTNTNNALTQALNYLGEGYVEIAPGVYRSADGMRQFRMTFSDLSDPNQGPHVHFETMAPDQRTITENSHVKLNDQK